MKNLLTKLWKTSQQPKEKPTSEVYVPKTEKMQRDALIYELLRDFPQLRDDDAALIRNVWVIEMQEQGFSTQISLMQFLKEEIYFLTPADGIVRYRRALQRKHEDLRGKYYKQRQSKQEKYRKEFGNDY